MFEYVLHRVVLLRNGPVEDVSFKERSYETLEDALFWQGYNAKLDSKLYKNYGYYIEFRIKLDYDNGRN